MFIYCTTRVSYITPEVFSGSSSLRSPTSSLYKAITDLTLQLFGGFTEDATCSDVATVSYDCIKFDAVVQLPRTTHALYAECYAVYKWLDLGWNLADFFKHPSFSKKNSNKGGETNEMSIHSSIHPIMLPFSLPAYPLQGHRGRCQQLARES